MSSSDPRDNPYGKDPRDDGPRDDEHARQPPPPESGGQPGHPYGPPSDPYGGGRPGGPGGPSGAMPDKVNSIRLVVLVTSVVQALFSLLVMIAFAMASQDLEEVYGDLEVGAGLYYTFFGASLVHAAVGILLATQFARGRIGGIGDLRTVLIVWAAFLVLLGIGALPLGLLWAAIGTVCIVLLVSPEAKAWFDRPRP